MYGGLGATRAWTHTDAVPESHVPRSRLEPAALASHCFPMSITITQAETDTCDHPDCEADYVAHNGVDGHCCEACAARHRGQNLLDHIAQDHTICASCWRRRKTVERPTAYARRGLGPVTDDALVGYEDHTEHVEMGPYGLECECGAIDHDIDGWDQHEGVPYHWYLKRVVDEMRREGQHDYHFDLETFADTLWQTDDLPLAVGRAID